jgi:PIN domain nuclease of toxin-antitoxin system
LRYLLDTHALIWIARAEKYRFSEEGAALLIADPGSVAVSAVSAWEMATKYRIGKLPGIASFLEHFEERVAVAGFVPLSMTIRHSLLAGKLDAEQKDPFDRFLAAQAMLENLIILSKDAVLDSFGVRRFW